MANITVLQAKEHLTKLKGKAISFAYLSKILGVSKQYLSQNQQKILTQEQIELIENNESIKFTDDNIKTITVKYFLDVIGSCGSGVFEQSQNYELLKLPQKIIENYSPIYTYTVMNAYGDSMNPTIKNNDKLIVEHSNSLQIIDNSIYVFVYDNQIFVKRLIKNIDEIIVVSDNPDKEIYANKKISGDNMNQLYIIGRVCGMVRNL